MESQGPSPALLAWSVQGQELGTWICERAHQGILILKRLQDKVGSDRTRCPPGLGPASLGSGLVLVWRSPLQTIYFQIHLLGLWQSLHRLHWAPALCFSLLPNLIITTTRCDRLPIRPI